jgi:hypothetical protein
MAAITHAAITGASASIQFSHWLRERKRIIYRSVEQEKLGRRCMTVVSTRSSKKALAIDRSVYLESLPDT